MNRFYPHLTRILSSKQISYSQLPDFIQEQIDRELYDRKGDESWEEYKAGVQSLTADLIEYNPRDPEDRKHLEFLLKGKIREEGEPDQAAVDEIGKSGKIEDAILIMSGTCSEGRHRLAASLKYNLPIKAYLV